MVTTGVGRFSMSRDAYTFMKYRLRAAEPASTGLISSGRNSSAVSMICTMLSRVLFVNWNMRTPCSTHTGKNAGANAVWQGRSSELRRVR